MKIINFRKLIWAIKQSGWRNVEISRKTGMNENIVLRISDGTVHKVEYHNGAQLIEIARESIDAKRFYELTGINA